MELVNLIYSRNSSVSETVNGKNFRSEWKQLFADSGFYNDGGFEEDRKVAGKLNLEHRNKEYANLKSEFDVNNLSCEGVVMEDQRYVLHNASCASAQQIPNQTEQLISYRVQKREIEKRKKDVFIKRLALSQFRDVFSPEQSLPLPVANTVPIMEWKEDLDLVYIVQIFRPVRVEEKLTMRKAQNIHRRLDHVIAVLGKHPLTALRDKIVCCADNVVLGEYSENPELINLGKRAKNVFKSAFFYIGDTFYNDLRFQDCIDYSRDLIQFSEESNRPLGVFQSKNMTEVKFEDMDIHLGYPYLYLHQGNCEHIIVFSDIRLLDPRERHPLNQYPMICRDMPRRRLACMICKTFTAKWMTTGNKRLSKDPFFFCNVCFQSFNYTVEGKIGDFKAYCYVDRTSI